MKTIKKIFWVIWVLFWAFLFTDLIFFFVAVAFSNLNMSIVYEVFVELVADIISTGLIIGYLAAPIFEVGIIFMACCICALAYIRLVA